MDLIEGNERGGSGVEFHRIRDESASDFPFVVGRSRPVFVEAGELAG